MAGELRRPDVPVVYTTGSFFEVGFDVGKTFADRIKGYWSASNNIQTILIPFVATPKGTDFYERTLKVCLEAFPQYITEIKGMADGSGFPFKNLFMLTLEKEIYNVLAPAQKETNNGCSDILINRPGCKVIAHNEDAYHVTDCFSYIVSARIVENGEEVESFTSYCYVENGEEVESFTSYCYVENGEEVESFTSYCYPGTIPGSTFSFNRYGMVFSSDGLYPSFIVEDVPTRIFLSRSVIKAKNIQEAIGLLKSTGYGVAYGFTFNMADIKDPSAMWSVEIGPQEGESKLHIHTLHEEADPSKPCDYIHINSIRHLQNVPEIPKLESSTRRWQRANQFDSPRTKEEVLTILGDTLDKEYPIYRSPRATDSSATIFTAVVDVLENRCDFYRENPANPDQQPLFHMQIKDGNN